MYFLDFSIWFRHAKETSICQKNNLCTSFKVKTAKLHLKRFLCDVTVVAVLTLPAQQHTKCITLLKWPLIEAYLVYLHRISTGVALYVVACLTPYHQANTFN